MIDFSIFVNTDISGLHTVMATELSRFSWNEICCYFLFRFGKLHLTGYFVHFEVC